VFNNYTNDSIYGRDKLLCIIAIVIKLHYCFGDTLENKWNFVHDDFLATLTDPPVKICYESETPLSVGQIIDIYDELPIPTKRYIVTAADKETLYEVKSAPLPEIKPKSESTLPPQYAGSFNYDDIPIFKGTVAGNSKNLYKKTQFDKAGKMWVKYFIYSLKRIQSLYGETFYYDEILSLARIVMLISFADVKGAARTCATYTSTIWPKVVNSNLEFHTYQQINNKPHYTKADGTTATYVDPWTRFNMESEEKRTLYTNIIQSVYTTATVEFAVKFIRFDDKQFPFIRTIIPSLESKNISRRIGYTQNILCNLDINMTKAETKSRSHAEFLFPKAKTMPTFIKDLRNILKTNFKILNIDSTKLKSVFHSTYCEGDCWFTNIRKKAEIPQIKLPFNGMGFAQFATDVRHSYSYLNKFIDAKKVGYVIEKPIDKGITIPLLFIESRNDIYAILRHASKTLIGELEAYDKTSSLNTPGFSVLSTDFKGPKRFSILNTKYDTPQTTLHMWRQATDEILKQTKPQAPELVRYYMTTVLEHMTQYSKRPDADFVFENVNLYKNLVKELEKTPHKIAGVEINCWFALLKIGGWFSPDVCEISLNRNVNFYDDKYFKDTKFLTGGKVVFKLQKTNTGNLKETKLNVTADKIYFDTNKPFDSTNISLLMYDEALKAPITAPNFYNYQYVYNLRFSDDFAAKESNIKQLPFDNYTHHPKAYAKYLENKTWTLSAENSPKTNPFPFCSLYTCYKLHSGRAALNPTLFTMPLNLEDGSARTPTYKLTKLLPTCDEYNWVTKLYNNTVTCDGKNPILRPIVPKVLPDGKKYQITGTQLKNYYGSIQSVVRIDNDFVTYYANLFSHTPVGGKARFQPDSDSAYNNHLKNIWAGDLTNINSLLTQPNKSGKFIPVFHGTADMSIASLICMNGFRISKSGMFGGGIYTAYSPNKPWMYSNPKSTRYIYENPDAPSTEYGYIFLCEAYVGNCIDIDMKRNRDVICKTDKELCSKWSPPTKNKGTVTDKINAKFWEKRNIDCILGVGSEQNELVFYNSTLILPKYMFIVKMIRFPLSKGISICNKKAKTKRIATVHSKRTTYRISK
jgi:hypothetical protein